MTENSGTLDLYELLPALYRLRDAEQGYPLRGLMDIIAQQAGIVKQDMDGLWDDFFIETCSEWVVPYIGGLVANNPFHEVAGRRRADVARTIHYRRRKGTLPMLEELARDVTGWGAHTVAFFELLGWMQHLEHLRFQSGWTDVRSLEKMDRVNGPFDEASHTVDVRRIAQAEGWHNIRNIGFFLWRLKNYPVDGVVPRQAAAPNDFGYHFSPLGNPAPLFNKPLDAPSVSGLSDELRVPGPVRHLAFNRNVDRYFREGLSLSIVKDGVVVPASQVFCANLQSWARPPVGKVAIDVERGRLAFAELEEPAQGVEVYYNYGFSADMGGGPYDRRQRRVPAGDPAPDFPDTVADPGMLDDFVSVTSSGADPTPITTAIDNWKTGQKRAVIQIEDNKTYEEDVTFTLSGPHLVIQAENKKRPTLIGDITVTGAGGLSRLTLSGLLISGSVRVRGSLGRLDLVDCTLVPGVTFKEDGAPASPGQASLVVDATNDRLQVQIERCITGALRLPAEMVSLAVRDSIIDSPTVAALAADDAGAQPGPQTVLERSTVFGIVHVKELSLASEVVFADLVTAERRQSGCVRFSYVVPGSHTPRRYHCQPQLAEQAAIEQRLALDPGLTEAEKEQVRLVVDGVLIPAFTARLYGLPGYAQLALRCPLEIRTGAEDGAEMGAFCRLKQPQRETNLRIRLQEYLPFGLEPGIIYVT